MKSADESSDCLWYICSGSESESVVMRTGVIWKSGCCCWWVSSRSGWLLELLTELTKMGILDQLKTAICRETFFCGNAEEMYETQLSHESVTSQVQFYQGFWLGHSWQTHDSDRHFFFVLFLWWHLHRRECRNALLPKTILLILSHMSSKWSVSGHDV